MNNVNKEKMAKKRALSKTTWHDSLISYIPNLIKGQWDNAREKN